MKEATGELNMTVVTVVAIAAVGALFYLLLWPAIRSSILRSTYCNSAVDCTEDRSSCYYYDVSEDGMTQTKKGPINCSSTNKNNNNNTPTS